MLGAGLDIGSSRVKGVVVEVGRRGAVSLREAIVISAAEFKSKPGGLLEALAKHRPAPFGKLPLGIVRANADLVFDRVRLPLPPEACEITERHVKAWLFEGTSQPPAGTDLNEDLWDLEVRRVFRRASDVEQLGGKFAEALFVRVPKADSTPNLPKAKALRALAVEPAGIALLEVSSSLPTPGEGDITLILDLGPRYLRGLLAKGTELLGSASSTVEDLEGQVAQAARVDLSRVQERMSGADLMGGDPASGVMRAAITRALQAIQTSLWSEDASRAPQRAVLCGGLASLRSMPRLVDVALGLKAEVIAQPGKIRSGLDLQAPFSAFAAAAGAAMRAAGNRAVALAPRRQAAPRPGRLGAAGGIRTGFSPLDYPLALLQAVYGGFVGLRDLPSRMGWGWIAVGALALLAMAPTAWFFSKTGTEVAQLEREYQEILPELGELERQAGLVNRYAGLSGTDALAHFPWGEVAAEAARKMPSAAYMTRLNANSGRLQITGRVRGKLDRQLSSIIRRLRDAPVLKRNGISPPPP